MINKNRKIIIALSLLIVTLNANAQWQETSLRTTVNSSHFISKLYYDGNVLWAGSLARIYKSEDKGSTWTEVSAGINAPQATVKDIIKLDNYIYVAFGGNGNRQVYRTNDAGQNWEIDTAGWVGIFFATNLYTYQDYLIAKLETNLILYKKNSDTQWTTLTVPDSRFYSPNTIFSKGDSLVLTSGQSGPALALTTDMGQTWTTRSVTWGLGLPSNGDWYGANTVWHGRYNKEEIFGVFRGFVTTPSLSYVYDFVKTTDGMITFDTIRGYDFSSDINTMWINNQDVFIGFYGSEVIHSTDGGQTWSDITDNLHSFVQWMHLPIQSLEVVDGNIFLSGNQNGVLMRATTTGIANITPTSEITLYPNPASNIVTINHTPIGSMLTITDITGKLVYNTAITNSQHTINTTDFENGVYIIKVITDKAILNKKLIINK